jgi:plastocyanin
MRVGKNLPGALALVAIAATACGSSTGGTASGAATPSPSGGPSGTTTSTSCGSLANIIGTVDDRGTALATGSSLTITAGDSFFQPTCTTRVPSGAVTLTITNSGSVLHNVSISSQNIDTDIPVGKTVTVHATVTGTVTYFCKYHRASGMQGALLIGGG